MPIVDRSGPKGRVGRGDGSGAQGRGDGSGARDGEAYMFGQHRVTVDGELVALRFVGAAGFAEVVGFHELLAQVLAERGRCYVLVNMVELTGIEARARRFVAEWNRRQQITAGAVYGAGFTARVFVKLLLNTVRLLNANSPEVHIARDEAEARRWLAARRAE